MSKAIMDTYVSILKDELQLAEGCTEPIAIAYAAALAREMLGEEPKALRIRCSKNIIKNARSVVVPNLGGLKGMAAAAIAGALGGDAGKKLEVLSGFDPGLQGRVRTLMQSGYCEVSVLESDDNLHIIAFALGEKGDAEAEIKSKHDNVTAIRKNGELVLKGEAQAVAAADERYGALNLQDIYDFANEVGLERVQDLIRRQIKHNVAISEEGMRGDYGANIGRLILQGGADDVERRACAYAAAGSDARMSGCSMAVVINSGSGNQGITVSVPVWVFAQHLGAAEEKLIRALCLSNLVSIYIKSMVGRLSAYCGAVSAASGSGAGIAYLHDGDFSQVANTVGNALVYISGIMCDGAKPSCAAKIGSSVQAAILGFRMAMKGNNFLPGDGLTGADPEVTLHNIARLASEGLLMADDLMVDIMLDN